MCLCVYVGALRRRSGGLAGLRATFLVGPSEITKTLCGVQLSTQQVFSPEITLCWEGDRLIGQGRTARLQKPLTECQSQQQAQQDNRNL